MNLQNKNLNYFIGQNKIKQHLQLLLKTSRNANSCFPHLLLHGPSGYGKTTLAKIIGHELNYKTWVMNGNLLQKPAHLISLFNRIQKNDIVFIDEIHAMHIKVIEILYSILSDNEINLILGKGYHAKVIKLKLPAFTLVGATTMLHKLTEPLINRFAIQWNFVQYSESDLITMIKNWMNQHNITINQIIINHLATISRGNPRTISNILEQLDKILIGKNISWKQLTNLHLHNILSSIGIYEHGITEIDIRYLKLFVNYDFNLGLQTIATLLNYPSHFIVNHIEPFLININFIVKQPRGRNITKKGLSFIQNLK